MHPALQDPAVKTSPVINRLPTESAKKTGVASPEITPQGSCWPNLQPAMRNAAFAVGLMLSAGMNCVESWKPPSTCAPIQFADDAKTPTPVLESPATPWFRWPPSVELSWPKTPENT